MFALVVWLQIQGQIMLTVQMIEPSMCAPTRAAMLTSPEVKRVSCAGDPQTIPKWVKQGQCVPVEVNERWVNFICHARGEWYAVR